MGHSMGRYGWVALWVPLWGAMGHSMGHSMGPSIGHNEVIGLCRVGGDAAGPGREHWAEMLANPRTPIEQWHPLVEVSGTAAPTTVGHHTDPMGTHWDTLGHHRDPIGTHWDT